MFHKASVILSNDANSLVERHEAFHVVFNLFLTAKQQEQILDEAFGRFGKDLGITKQQYETAKKDNNKDLLLQLEEAVADLMGEHRDSPSLFNAENKVKYPKITQFFDTIYNWLYDQYDILNS